MPSTPSPVLATARQVADPHHLRAALRVTTTDATVAAALRCGAAVGLTLAASAAAGRTDLAGFAALGALASLYGRYDPYRRRAAVLAGAGGLLVVAFVLTAALTAAGAPLAVALGAVALLSGAATVLCVLVRTGPPGATIVVFAAAGGIAGPVGWHDVLERGLAGAAGAAIAWAVCMSGYLVRPSAPARLAVRRAADALRRADDVRAASDGDPAAADAVEAAHRAVAHARTVLADDLSHRRTRDTALVLAAELAVVAGPADALPARRNLRDTARATWPSAGWRLTGVRVVLAGLASGALALVAGFGHPAWAQMGSTATLQGTTTHHAVVRALQRGAGTALGALVAWPLLSAHLSFAATAVVVVGLQVVTEVVVGRHYGLAMLTITPMALLMTSLGGAGDPSGMALSRALDTVLGAALGVLAVVVVHPRRAGRAAG